ncbi:conserved protein of unknown function [Pseudodesulfovibrio profundus]|uniref:Uncharacterized protein n=1 Tax=Pseudodesulfovibrio profundus TaxID=57320 RepID=A0A2C8FCK7_9BACT|nr:hypothetical protein [Pseudodesulfovibrio profundus]SOB60524.1 conserved protein of unknown function [Pseudodesulfovibrio profundus]
MTWNPITLAPPPSLQAVHDELQGCRGAAPNELDASQNRLAAVNGAIPIASNPVAAAAAGVEALRIATIGLLQAGGHFLCLHPYIHPLGDRRGEYAYLTPQQTVTGMADKLADPQDVLSKNSLESVFLLLRGVDHDHFAAVLDAFCTLFPVTELMLAKRRAKWLATLEKDKLIRAVGPVHPSWHSHETRRHPRTVQLDQEMGGLLGMAEGYEQENTRPEAELNALIEKKRTHLQELDAAWTLVTDALRGDSGVGLALNGNMGSIRRQLKENTPPVEGYKLSALCCWIGSIDDVAFIREMVSL